MRLLSLAAVAAAAAVAYLMPAPEAPQPDPAVEAEAAAVAVCAVEEGAGRSTEVSILSTVDGPAALTLLAGGEAPGSIGLETGPSGSVVVPVVDVAAVGSPVGLVEMPAPSSAAGTVVTGSTSLSAEACEAAPGPQALIAGGSTASGWAFELRLMNPYAGEAVVDLSVQSEVGAESTDRLESVIVPSRSSRVVDFNELTPGREMITVTVDTRVGRVAAVGRQGREGEVAVWRAVAPAQEWFVPVPAGPGAKELLIATSADGEVAYEVALHGPDGVDEGFAAGTLPPKGRAAVDLAALGESAGGLRVLAAGPVAATLWVRSETALAATTGSPVSASRWFLPGASAVGSGRSSAVIFNAGIDDDTVVVRPLKDGAYARSLALPAESAIEVGLAAADGYLIESTGPMAAAWAASRGEAAMLAGGVPAPGG